MSALSVRQSRSPAQNLSSSKPSLPYPKYENSRAVVNTTPSNWEIASEKHSYRLRTAPSSVFAVEDTDDEGPHKYCPALLKQSRTRDEVGPKPTPIVASPTGHMDERTGSRVPPLDSPLTREEPRFETFNGLGRISSLHPGTTIRGPRPKTLRGREYGQAEKTRHEVPPIGICGDRKGVVVFEARSRLTPSAPIGTGKNGDGQKVGPKEVLKPKLATLSTLVLSPDPAAFVTPLECSYPRPHSPSVTTHKPMIVGGNNSADPLTETKITSTAPRPPPRHPRRAHRVPPPLVLFPLPSTKNFKTEISLTPTSGSSFQYQFQPPPTPLSPALSIMSSTSGSSTFSTISGVMVNHPKAKRKGLSEKELRRRRFLKLTKTLGEDVPPELVQVKVPVPRGSRAAGFASSMGKGAKSDHVFGIVKLGQRKKNERDSFCGRGTSGSRNSIVLSPLLHSNSPPIPGTNANTYDQPLSPMSPLSPISPMLFRTPSPNVLCNYPLFHPSDKANLPGPSLSNSSSCMPRTATSVPSPGIQGNVAQIATPDLMKHPFRVSVEDESPSSMDACFDGAQGDRDSTHFIQNPWMRDSLDLDIAFDIPLFNCGPHAGTFKASQMRHHRRSGTLGARPTRRTSIVHRLPDDLLYGNNPSPLSDVGSSAIGGLHS
ncbi:hypothetical protein NMY22_g8141 [Coprinellus aureogranulatus]|nr:hypothetical protein NMY22_g8141 [Coprinellus aureogranulatus]